MWYHLFNSLLVLSLAYVSNATDCIRSDSYLESLSCTKILDPFGCVIRYNCTETLSIQMAKNQCFFNGRVYNYRSKIEVSREYCKFGCRCGSRSEVVCAEFDCPIYDYELKQGCYYRTKNDQCCPSDIVCESRLNVITCIYNGKKYLEGMVFNPDTCWRCICQNGFRGVIEEPFCKQTKCQSDTTYYRKLKQKCAPIYVEDHCCPVLFTCAHESDGIISRNPLYELLANATEYTNVQFRTGERPYPRTDEMCEYGDTFLNVGDTIKVSSIVAATCTCITPPVITCVTRVPYDDVDLMQEN